MTPFRLQLSAELEVRAAKESDLRALEWEGGADLRSWYQSAWEAHEGGQILYLVGIFNGFPAAQIVVNWEGRSAKNAREQEVSPDLQSLRVHPMLRGLGIGTYLLSAAEAAVRAREFGRVGLSVGTENGRARRLYERLGYQLAGEPYDDRWSFVDARGQSVEVCERIVDLAKELGN